MFRSYTKPATRPIWEHSRGTPRRGTILVLSAILMVVMMGFIALSLDVGYISCVQTEMDRSVDASALAGVGALPQGSTEAEFVARSFAAMNNVGSTPLAGSDIDVSPGHWDADVRVFTIDSNSPTALRVTGKRTDQRPLFFANVWGIDNFEVNSTSIAMFEPREIMVVQDYSASMNDDSEFRSIDALGRTTVEGNLAQIYAELGSPTFGNGALAFAPNWMTVPGQEPDNTHKPQIYVTHKFNSVIVASTKELSRVKVYGDDGAVKTVYGTGVYDDGLWSLEVSAKNGRRARYVKVRSGYKQTPHTSEYRYNENFDFESSSDVRSAARKAFGLNGVSYPYPSGSWDDYLNYCISTSSSNRNKRAGYLYKFGYMSWVNYLLEKKPRYSQTPDLWMTSEQPITAVKNAVDVFLNYMQSMNSGDRVGLAIYNAPDGWGKLEQGLTENFSAISQISRQRQAGHYHSMTNIAAGLNTARQELMENGRVGVVKRIVLMTDGVPTWPQSSSYARSLALQAAQQCADDKVSVTTISLGAGADVPLMQQIAEMTGGIHYRVPGGRPIAEIEQDLLQTFAWVAADRPVRLVSTTDE